MFSLLLIIGATCAGVVGTAIACGLAQDEPVCEWQSWHPVMNDEYNPLQDADGTYLFEREM